MLQRIARTRQREKGHRFGICFRSYISIHETPTSIVTVLASYRDAYHCSSWLANVDSRRLHGVHLFSQRCTPHYVIFDTSWADEKDSQREDQDAYACSGSFRARGDAIRRGSNAPKLQRMLDYSNMVNDCYRHSTQ